MEKTADRVVVGLEVEDEIYQVPLKDEEQVVIMNMLKALFDGNVAVLPDPLPVKFEDKVNEEEVEI